MQRYAGAVSSLPGVSDAILQGHAPMGRDHPTASFVYRYADMKGMRETKVEVEIGDSSFIPFYKMQLVSGGDVYQGENIVPVVINETYARMLGFKDPKRAAGSQLLYRENGLWYTVSGVVKDYHQSSFHETIRPLIIITWLSDAKSVAVRLGVRGDAAKTRSAAVRRVRLTGVMRIEAMGGLSGRKNPRALPIAPAAVPCTFLACPFTRGRP